jgi:hypothetical protein
MSLLTYLLTYVPIKLKKFLDSNDERNEELVNIGDLLESIIWSSIVDFKNNSYLPHFEA